METTSSDQFARVSIVGLGYIGLPTACMFAIAGVPVTGVDVRRDVVDRINSGEAHIEEQGLSGLVSSVVASGKLKAVLKPAPADAFIIAVPTPVHHDRGHQPDLSYVDAAARSIAPVLKKGDLVVLESTAPVGTTRRLAGIMAKLRPDLTFPLNEANEDADIRMAYCPERVIPGHMLRELVENDRVVGGLTTGCAEHAAALYSIFVHGKIFETDAATAETVKLAENAYRDVNIAYANELAHICTAVNVDPWKVIQLANRHPRVSILKPGPGVGGHCIAVDPWFLVAQCPEKATLIRAAREVNERKPDQVVAQVRETVAGMPEARIVCLGLTYKPDIDDFRESPSLEIAKALAAEYKGRVTCVDPSVHTLPSAEVNQLGCVTDDHVSALRNADLAVMLVGHSAFRNARPPKMVIDTVGFWHGAGGSAPRKERRAGSRKAVSR